MTTRAVLSYRAVEGVDPYRNLAAAVLTEALQSGHEGIEWLRSRDEDVRFWCDVAGLRPTILLEKLGRLAREATGR